ncbi:UNVERIFIED_CONTAM: hypothetical protein HDU68_010743 [Siphonaria sp. JEL0065]|nr:hypothetical protein HDU68_010743 [Siphonaria sp. JEL0065]
MSGIEGNGQPDLAQSFLKIALNLIQVLRLDVDPDDSPWLYQFNLSPREKEDRRRAFWCIFWYASKANATSADVFDMQINSDKIKGPSAVTDPYPIFETSAMTKPLCNIYTVMASVKKLYSTSPKSIHDILFSEKVLKLHTKMSIVHSELPIDHLLISESPEVILQQDRVRFISQQDRLVGTAARAENLNSNIEVFASTCVLNRPILYLSALKSCHPSRITIDVQNIIASSISQCLDASHRILNLVAFFLDPRCLQTTLPSQNSFYPVLEAVIVLWFATCRMDPVWWSVMQRKRHEWRSLKALVLQAIAFVERLKNDTENHGGGGGHRQESGVVPPISICMRAMVREIEENEASRHFIRIEQSSNNCSDGGGIGGITLGMTVVSLDGSDESVIIKEPKAYLGLLGMQVGGVKWPGPIEESWRLFWKLN